MLKNPYRYLLHNTFWGNLVKYPDGNAKQMDIDVFSAWGDKLFFAEGKPIDVTGKVTIVNGELNALMTLAKKLPNEKVLICATHDLDPFDPRQTINYINVSDIWEGKIHYKTINQKIVFDVKEWNRTTLAEFSDRVNAWQLSVIP